MVVLVQTMRNILILHSVSISLTYLRGVKGLLARNHTVDGKYRKHMHCPSKMELDCSTDSRFSAILLATRDSS